MTRSLHDDALASTAKRTEADAIAEVGRLATEPHELQPGKIYAVHTPTGVQTIDLDKDTYRPTPRRKTGTVEVEDVDSFLAYWRKHADDSSELYVDIKRHTVTAVLDANQADSPRWGQHRLVLKLKTTDRWNDWTGLDRKPMTQVQWAEFIEDHLDDIREPAAAEMLEIAQTFQATTNATFKSNVRLTSGQFTLNWEENVNATAGEAGQRTVPSEFLIGIAPFDFSDAYQVNARFRYRVSRGDLTVLFLLNDPDAIIRDAVLDVVAQIETELSPADGPAVKVMRGTPA